MLSEHKASSLIILVLLFLLPIFFIPGGALGLGVVKATLFAFGVIAAALAFLFEVWRMKKLDLPWHPLILIVFLLPIVYLVSALSSTPSFLALFGYNFEVGTFGFMLLASILLILVSIIFTGTEKILQVLTTILVSLLLVTGFVVIKIFTGGTPVWGIFFSNTANPIGEWTDLAIALGLLSILLILALGMIPMNKFLRPFCYLFFGLSTALLAIINFSIAFIFTLGASTAVLIYFLKVEKRSQYIFLPVILGLISIILLINPTISSTRGTLSDVVSDTFKVVNIEVRPSFSATLSISKAVLSQGIFLGSGPNTFSHDWLIHKPVNVNATPFWAVAFPFGIGFIPTQIASTGAIGTILWAVFFFYLIFLGIKALIKIPESRVVRFGLISSLVALLYLWVASFFYTPSSVILALTFIFSGLFVAISREAQIISSREIIFSRDVTTGFISTLIVVVASLGFILLGFVSFNKTISSFYYQKAINLSNTPGTALSEIENQLNKAIKFAPADIHYVALSKLYFSEAQTAAVSTSGSLAENQAIFQDAVSKNIKAAQDAVRINPAGYENWVTLGMIYSALVPPPLSVEGAYENAKIAYNEALKRNPLSPEAPLFLAQLELNNGNAEAARSLIKESIVLKEDYTDAYLMLAQLEIRANNIREAIISAERVSLLVPDSPGIRFELGLLKYSSGDYSGASNAFAQALNLVPDYANAQYYLGLSLTRLGRFAEALRQFESLSVTNPNNEEVKLILNKLRAGQSPF